jgi:GNAT superfamily N-acetyltransferase
MGMILNFVENEEKYFEFIRLLRMDPRVAYGFVDHTPITSEQQKKYMANYEKCYYICLADGVPAGFIGVVNRDIRIATLPEYQRKGIGTFMIKELIKKHPDSYARVKINNEISLNFFKKLGFNLSFHIMTPPEN